VKSISGNLSINEEVYLRALTGYLVGRNLFENADRIAIIMLPDRICLSIAASVATSLISKRGYSELEGKIRIYEYSRESIRRAVNEFKPDTVILLYGGEHRLQEVKEAFINTLKELSENGFKGTLIIHVRILLATNKLNDTLGDARLVEYLNSLREVRTFTADLSQGKFIYHRVKFTPREVVMEKIGESNLTSEHISLLKASLPPK